MSSYRIPPQFLPSSSSSAAAASSRHKYAGSSFADRITYFPLNVEEMPTNIERQYLLGGGRGKQKEELLNTDIDQPLPPRIAERTLAFSNLIQMLLGVGLVVVCWYESTDSRNADEHCPLLYIGIFIGSLVTLVSLFGFIGFFSAFGGTVHVPSKKTVLYIYHTGALLSMILLTLLAVSTLLHWDVGGQPVYDTFHQTEVVGVRHRFLIWGISLVTALATVAAIFGMLGLEWSDGDAIFLWTLFTSSFFVSAFGGGLVAIAVCIVYYGELELLPHPGWVITSAIGGLFMVFTGIWGMIIRDAPGEHNNIATMSSRLTNFIIFISVGAAVVLVASVGNAITAEQDSSSDRRTLALLAGLIGIWGQLTSIVALTAAARWRYVYSKDLQKSKTCTD
jgi:hypothetical protein